MWELKQSLGIGAAFAAVLTVVACQNSNLSDTNEPQTQEAVAPSVQSSADSGSTFRREQKQGQIGMKAKKDCTQGGGADRQSAPTVSVGVQTQGASDQNKSVQPFTRFEACDQP